MFGKSKKSSNDRFVMAAGRAAGNLKAAGTPFNKKKALPTNGGEPVRGDKGAPFPMRPRAPSLGKVNTFKTSGINKK